MIKKCSKKNLRCWSGKTKDQKRYTACACKNNKTKRVKCSNGKIRNKKTGRCVKSTKVKQIERKKKIIGQVKLNCIFLLC